jgi:phospholipid/cholesterol/gamma-HCH transport system substrate-binding protein
VVLFGGTVDGPATTEGQTYEVVPVASTDEMLAMLQENNRNMQVITADIRVLTAKLVAGEGTVGKLLHDEALYDTLLTSAGSLEVATDNARELTASIGLFAGRLNQEGSLPHQLVTDREVFPAIAASAAELRVTATRAAALATSLEQRAADPDTVLGVLLHDKAAGDDTQTTLNNLALASHLLAEDLEAAQHNFLLRHAFKKREREAARDAREAERAAGRR